MLSKLRHPVRAIREPFGTAGLILACVALIVALSGGAYAASGGLTAKQKKEVKKIAQQFAGKPGAPGGTGPAGAGGAAGANGKDGANGTNGTNGTQGPAGEAGMCSAEEPECQLAPGGVLTGVWAAGGGEGDDGLAAISFPVQVSPAPTAVYESNVAEIPVGVVLEDGKTSLYGPYTCIEGCTTAIADQPDPIAAIIEDEEALRGICPGTADEPKAVAGYLCIYLGETVGSKSDPSGTSVGVNAKSEKANPFGVTVLFEFTGDKSYLRGSWAVAG